MSVVEQQAAAAADQYEVLAALLRSHPNAYNAIRRLAVSRTPAGPAPPVIIPHTYKMVFQYLGPNGVKASNVLWGQAANWNSQTNQCQQVSAAMSGAYTYTNSLITILSPQWTLENCYAYDAAGTNNFAATNTNEKGTYVGSGTCFPPNVAAVISWDTNEKYKGGKPRTYIPGIDTAAAASNGSNDWAGTFITALKAAAAVFIQELITQLLVNLTGVQVGTIHRSKANAWLTPPTFAAYSDVPGDIRVHERIDSQRRRLGKEIPGT